MLRGQYAFFDIILLYECFNLFSIIIQLKSFEILVCEHFFDFREHSIEIIKCK